MSVVALHQNLRSEFKEVIKYASSRNNIDFLCTKISSYKNTDTDLKTHLDQAFRDYLFVLLRQEVSVQTLKNFVDLSIEACRKSLISYTIPVILLGDIFECVPLEVCHDMFTFVEDKVHVWKEEQFFSPCKNLLLRLCNDLLRRLSRAIATVFCGRILLFLAKFFPFSERSGLNIVSEFNLENVTEYGTDEQDDVVEIKTEDEEKSVKIDFSFYCKFWQLQDFFRNPNQCYDKVQWKVFCSHSTNVLNTFHGIKLDYVENKDQNMASFAKYLTSKKLLDLQLHDVNFRRSVLLQFLITFQYLTSTVKFKSDSYELKQDQTEWIQNSIDRVYALLKETPPDGETFAAIIKNILKREEFWNTWKNDGCPDVKKLLPQHDSSEVVKTKRSSVMVGDLVKQAGEHGKCYLGNPELTKLWNINPNNLEACKDRDFLPSLEDYFSEVIAQMDNPTSAKEELFKDINFGWRALRLLARRSPYFFSITSQNHPLPKYLETMVMKMAHEMPGTKGENGQDTPQEQEMDENIQIEEQTAEEFKQNVESTQERNHRGDSKPRSKERFDLIVEKIAPDWEKLGTKLGYKADEIEWFRNENPDRVSQASNMMQLWFEDDEDANLDNLLYILEGLEMNEAADFVRNEINGVGTDPE